MSNGLQDLVERDGFALVRGVLSPAQCSGLASALAPASGAGTRGILAQPAIQALAGSATLLALVRPHLPAPPVAVRGIYFDKTSDANWGVPWHQDLTLRVRERRETPGFGPWSVKDGSPHVQPPVALLESMLTIRLHLDDAAADNGALRVLPGSHREGRLSAPDIQAWLDRVDEVTCTASVGDALLMRPLLLHASSKATHPRHRRIIHLEYAAFALPNGLEWEECVHPA